MGDLIPSYPSWLPSRFSSSLHTPSLAINSRCKYFIVHSNKCRQRQTLTKAAKYQIYTYASKIKVVIVRVLLLFFQTATVLIMSPAKTFHTEVCNVYVCDECCHSLMSIQWVFPKLYFLWTKLDYELEKPHLGHTRTWIMRKGSKMKSTLNTTGHDQAPQLNDVPGAMQPMFMEYCVY